MMISCLSSLLMLIPCTLPVYECFLSFKSIQLFYYHVSLLIKMYKSMLNGDYSVCPSETQFFRAHHEDTTLAIVPLVF